MTVAEYMQRHKMSQTAFAALVGCNQATISRLLQGRRPDTMTAAKIIDATQNKVKFADLIKGAA